MSHGRATHTPAPAGLARLFDGSSLVGLTDGELLARFVASRDESAFEGLVARLGPMVLGVCRRMLPDRADADDAFQATFLVLVRRASAVGRGDLIGPWLHGVAVRVCRRARGRSAQRRLREQTGVEVDALPPSSPFAESTQLDQAEIQATIDSEIARLPETYRRLVILCDVEGLTRSEAADRLGWTPNMVRGRLARARTRLRANLTRRGCTPPGLAPSTIEASGLAALPWILSPPPTLIVITARAAMATLSPSGRTLAATLASTSALSLAEGVIRAMFVTSWKFVGAGLLAAGALAAGTTFLNAQSSPDPKPNPAPPPTITAPSAIVPETQAPTADEIQAKAVSRPDRSLYLVRPDLAFYLDNKAAFPGLTDTFLALDNSETTLDNDLQSPKPTDREAAMPAHIARVKDLQRDLKSQNPTDPLVAKKMELIRLALEQAETRGSANRSNSDHPDLKTLRAERLRNAQIRRQAQQAFYDEGRITIDRLIDANRQVIQAEQVLAVTPQERRASLETYVDRLRKIHDKELREFELGRATTADIAEAADNLLEARILLAQQADERNLVAGKTNPPQAANDLDRRLTEVEKKVDRILDLLNSLPDRTKAKR